MNVGARIVLFLSSYAPLTVIYAVQYWARNWLIFGVACGVTVSSIVIADFLLSHVARSHAINPDIVDGCCQTGGEVMGYVASYLVPFLTLSLSDVRQVLALAFYLVVLGYLYVTTNMIAVNPTIQVLLRYRVYDVTLRRQGSQQLITRRNLHLKDELWVARIGSNVIIEGKVTVQPKAG